MRNRELEFILTAKDMVTATFNRVQGRLTAGANQLAATFSRVGNLLMAGAFAVGVKKAIEHSNQQGASVTRLNSALDNAGVTAVEVSKDLQEYASALQRTTKYGDEAVNEIMATLIAMRGTTDQIKPLTKATLDLAAGLKIDAESAAMLIAKTLEGRDALSRYGISVKGAAGETAKMAAIIETIQKKFGGFAEEAAKTTGGRMKQLENQWGDFLEIVGDTFKEVAAALLPIAKELLPILQQQFKATVAYIKITFIDLYMVVANVAAAIEKFMNWLGVEQDNYWQKVVENGKRLRKVYEEEYAAAFDIARDSTDQYTAAMNKLTIAQTEVLLKEMELAKVATEQHLAALKTREGVTAETIAQVEQELAAYKAYIVELQVALAEKNSAMRTSAEANANTLENLQNKLQGMESEFKKMVIGTEEWEKARLAIENLKATIEDLGKTDAVRFGENMAKSLDEITTKAKESSEATQQYIEDLFGGAGGEEQMKVYREQAEVINDIHISERQRSLDAESLALDAWYEESIQKAHENVFLLEEIDKEYFKRKRDLARKNERDIASTIISYASQAVGMLGKYYAQASESRVSDMESERDARLGMIDAALENEKLSEEERAKLMAERARIEAEYQKRIKEEKRKAWYTEKSIAISEAIMNTAVAVIKALPNIVLAAIVGAMGAAQVGLIMSQTPPKFHEGGAMTFDAAPNREMPILIRGGETVRVTTPEQERAGGAPARATNVTININSPVPAADWVVDSVKKALRQTGLTVDKLLVNQKNRTVINAT